MSFNIRLDRNSCIGCGSCYAAAPKVFKLDSEMKCMVADNNGSDDKTILEIAQNCPVSGIVLCDQETGKQVFP